MRAVHAVHAAKHSLGAGDVHDVLEHALCMALGRDRLEAAQQRLQVAVQLRVIFLGVCSVLGLGFCDLKNP